MRFFDCTIPRSWRNLERLASTMGRAVLALSLILAGVVVAFTAATHSVTLNHVKDTAYYPTDPYITPETYGGTNPTEPCAGCDVWGKANPSSEAPFTTNPDEMVNPATGDLTDSYTLFSTPGIGAPLSLTLTYDSLEAQAYTRLIQSGGNPSTPANIGDAWGYGWTAQTGARFWSTTCPLGGENYDCDAIVLPDGAVDDFFYNGTASPPPACPQGLENATASGSTYFYCAPDRVDATWGVYTGYGTSMLIEDGGLQTIAFGVNGPILYQGNLHNSGALFYDAGLQPTKNGCPESFNFEGTSTTVSNCTVVSDTAMNPVQYYVVPLSANAQVMGVQDPAGHDWYTNYSCTVTTINNTCNPDLTSFDDPNGNWWGMSYDSSNPYTYYDHDLLTLRDPDNNTTTISYVPDNSGVTPEDLVGSIQDAAGNTPTRYSGWSVYLQQNPGSGDYATKITYPDGHWVQDQYQELMLNGVSKGGSDTHWNTASFESLISGTDPGPYQYQIEDPSGN